MAAHWFVELQDREGYPIPDSGHPIPRHVFPANCQPRAIASDYAETFQKANPDATSYVLLWFR